MKRLFIAAILLLGACQSSDYGTPEDWTRRGWSLFAEAEASVRSSATGHGFTRTTSLPTASTFSVCMWERIQVNRAATSTVLALKDTGAGNEFDLETAAGGLQMQLAYTDKNTAMTTQVVGSWYFLCVTRNGTTFTGYMGAANGGAITTFADTDATTYGTWGSLRLSGEIGTTTTFWNGAWCALKMWSATLGATEIANEQYHLRPQRVANINGYYAFLDSTTSVVDTSGQGNNLTAVSTVTTESGPPAGWE